MLRPTVPAGRISVADHESRPWRIREIAPDFTVEDVWALPAQGGSDAFQSLLALVLSLDPAKGSRATQVLFDIRSRLGHWFGWDDAAARLPIPGENESSLANRLPADLRNTAADLRFTSVPFAVLYRTEVEFAAEASNRTVHGVLHLAWVDQGDGHYQGQMAIYVKPRGSLGKGYLWLIKPFRYWVVYPALMRSIGHAWNARMRDVRRETTEIKRDEPR